VSFFGKLRKLIRPGSLAQEIDEELLSAMRRTLLGVLVGPASNSYVGQPT